MSGPLDSNTRVIGFWPRRLLLLLLYYCCCYSGYASACCSDRFSCLAFIPALKLLPVMPSLAVIADPPRALTRTESRCQSHIPCRFCQPSRSTKTRSPPPAFTPAGPNHSACQNSQVHVGFLRKSSSAISGFRSLCGREQRSSLKPSRSIGPAFWNLSLGRALALRTLAFTRSIYGASNPGPMLWPERSRSRANIPSGFFAFQSGFIGAIFGPRRPAECPPDRLWRAPRSR